MKKLLFLLLIIPSISNGQAISRLIRFLTPPITTTPYNIVTLDTSSQNRMKVVRIDSLKTALNPLVWAVSSSNLTVVGTNNVTVNLPNVVTAGTYNRVTVDATGRTTSGAVDSIYVATRALNSNYTISSTRSAWVVYSISILSNAGNTGTVFLEYSPDASVWSEASRTSNSSNGVGNTQIGIVAGRIPANYFVRLRSVTGGTTITFISGQETLL